MPLYQTTVIVKLRPSILDPEGKAIEHALHSLQFHQLSRVRVGKEIELTIDADTSEQAQAFVDDACRKLLANPVMEDYTFTIKEVL